MKKRIIKILAFLARRVIKRYQPKIVAISGSVGKTGTKEVVALVLSKKFRVGSSLKNYNNEFGLPLSILGQESPGKSVGGWLRILFLAGKLLIIKDKKYPEILVLELGVDRPGDMDYLLSIVEPDIGVLTNISQSHIEYFGSVDEILKEKSKLLKAVKKDGLAVLNYDNKYLRDLSEEIKIRQSSYGLRLGADILAKDLNFIFPENLNQDIFCGLNFKIEYQGSVLPLKLNHLISLSQLYATLASIAVALDLGLNLLDISQALESFLPLPGRMRVLPGIKNSLLIDDTYNSSPESSLNALKTLEKINRSQGRKIVIFGDILELGSYSEEGHRLVGEEMAKIGLDLICLIGEKARDIGRGAIKAGFDKDRIFNFASKEEARSFLKNRIEEFDLILFKASQGVRLEKLVKEFLVEPQKASELLVRQEKFWQD